MQLPLHIEARLLAAAAFVAAGLLVHSGVSHAAVRSGARRAEAPALLEAMDRFRVQHGLSSLRPSDALERAAMAHDLDMIRFGFFGHSSHGGGSFWRRVERWYPPRSQRWTVGENLLAASPDISAASTFSHWLASPEHRAVLLDPNWVSVGIAVVHVAHAAGIYGGQPTTLVTADFGREG
jgi:uncharacterized protein YkwD